MPAGGLKWTVRVLLLAAALSAPMVGFAMRSGQTGDAEVAIPGLGWGLAGTVAALGLLASTWRASPTARLGYFAAGLVAVLLLLWLLMVGAANIWPSLV